MLRHLLSALTLLIAAGISDFSFALGEIARNTYSFKGDDGLEMQLELDERTLKITGEMRGPKGTEGKVQGANSQPGHLWLQFEAVDGSYSYRLAPCDNRLEAAFKEKTCGPDVWVSKTAPAHIQKFQSCDSECRHFPELPSSRKNLDGLMQWSHGGGYGCAVTLPTGVSRKRVVKILHDNGVRALVRPKAMRREISVPCGLEAFSSSVIQKLQVRSAAGGIVTRGSETLFATFSHGTFFSERPNPMNLAAQVSRVKSVIADILTQYGLQALVVQGSRGGSSFLVTIIGRSPQLQFPDGYWFTTKLQLSFMVVKASVEAGFVDAMQSHVIGTKIFKAPASFRPTSNQFQSIAVVDPELGEASTDEVLNIAVANVFAERLKGVITSMPEGL